ncbi:UNVERIFIED_CONTAM: hypothetical protein RMT77_003181 [Armadillidium vulgare]
MKLWYSVTNFLPHLKPNGLISLQKCYISKRAKKINSPLERAKEYCDRVYTPVYGEKWKKIKKALYTDVKYGAILNNFSDTSDILEVFESLGAYDVGKFYAKSKKIFPCDDITETGFGDQEKLAANRPSLKELTDEEKIEAMKNAEIGHYPEEYRKIAIEKGVGVRDFDYDESRVIKSSQVGDSSEFKFDHIPSTRLKGLEEGFIEEADVFHGLKNTQEDTGATIITEKEPITWPENLKFFSFVKGETISTFPSPVPSNTVPTFTHYLINAASILPVLALDIEQGDDVLDLCSGPGGKSLAILQTLLPNSLVCNDISLSRLNRVKYVMNQYIPEGMEKLWDKIYFSNTGHSVTYNDFFDKVLVDAPCLNDRLSLQEPDNNIFKTNRAKERLQLPETQADLIVSALKMTKPGGSVVYSTCTLSPLQNDGAVHLALAKIWRETKIDCCVVNMMQTVRNLSFMYAIGHNLKLRYGHIILPFPDNNCGPMYISKIIRER